MGLPDILLAALKVQDFVAPTPVQVAAQQPILAGRNVALQSPTGTGKTLAYLLPLLSQLQPWQLGRRPHPQGRVLVLCPTQELCMQVLRVARSVMPANRHKAQALVGGANAVRQLAALKEHKPCIVVATPGRLLKVIHKGGAFTNAFPLATRSSSSSSQHRMTLVFEEADKLLAMSDTVQVLRLLAAALSHDTQQILQPAAAPDPAAESHPQQARLGHAARTDSKQEPDDLGSQDVQQSSQDPSFMRAVMSAYQVLLVSAGLKPNTLARAPAWMASDPVMIAAPRIAAPVVTPARDSLSLRSSSSRSSSNSSSSSSSETRRRRKGASTDGDADVATAGMRSLESGSSSSDSDSDSDSGSEDTEDTDLECIRSSSSIKDAALARRSSSSSEDIDLGRLRSFNSSLSSGLSRSIEDTQQLLKNKMIPKLPAMPGVISIDLHYESENVAHLPEHIQHQYLLYPAGDRGTLRKYLARCLASYLRQGCKALVFVGQHTRIAEQLQLRLKTELGSLCSKRATVEEKATLLRRFNSGQLRALLLSDQYSLGLDFKKADVVLMLEKLPRDQVYVHRAGRTGRMGGPGTVISIIPDDRADALRQMLKRLRITPQEMVLRALDASSGGGSTIEPKVTLPAAEAPSDAMPAGSKAPGTPSKQQQQQQQQAQQQQQQQAQQQRPRQAQQQQQPKQGHLKPRGQPAGANKNAGALAGRRSR